jgi:hypothetical protein
LIYSRKYLKAINLKTRVQRRHQFKNLRFRMPCRRNNPQALFAFWNSRKIYRLQINAKITQQTVSYRPTTPRIANHNPRNVGILSFKFNIVLTKRPPQYMDVFMKFYADFARKSHFLNTFQRSRTNCGRHRRRKNKAFAKTPNVINNRFRSRNVPADAAKSLRQSAIYDTSISSLKPNSPATPSPRSPYKPTA